MPVWIFAGVAFLITLSILGPVFYLHSRKVLREQKNYERGLKMVPLLIQLPPPSEDKEAGSRDEREVIDENISKAQILYTIIASTLQKGFKTNFYGQRHFGFEVIASYGFVKFYAAVPTSMVDVVTQAVISAYPSARLEEVPEHNIFSPIGRISGTVGGELTLKEPFAYPIATYQDLKRDPLQSLLNSLSSLEKDDGIGIQILLRPAHSGWRKQASEIASKKRKGDKSGGVASWWFKQLFLALWQPPEEKEKKDGDKKELSGLDQAILDSIDDKTRHAGYETLIRVVSSSNVSQRAQAALNNVVAAFAVYDAQGKNGFKFTPARDIEQFVSAFILRFFPQENRNNVLNAVELASMFHFPDQRNIPTSQLERQSSKQVDAPRNLPDEGLFMGYNIFRGVKKAIRLAKHDRQRHMYVVGQTGTGKSTFLENLAFQDMLNGDGFAFIDPHGDTAELLLAKVPKERAEDVIYFCPAEMDYPMGLNMFEFQTDAQKDFLIQEAINMLYKLYDPQRQGIIGPRYEHIFRNCALLLMADPQGGTFVDIPKLLIDKEFMQSKLKYTKDRMVLDFWLKEWPNSQRSNESGEVTSWVVSKFGAFMSNEMMRNIIGQTKSAFNLRDVMDNKKILIVNLSKGRTGELNSKLLGMIFVMKFQAAAMSRANVPENERQDFCLYVDEFQNFSTDSFATIMSEARKYHLNLVVANQFTTQLSDDVRDAVFGNMGTIVSFRVGQNDVEILSKYFHPLFEPEDLLRVPNYNTIVRTLVSGVPTQSFSMATVPELGEPNPQLKDALKQLSAAKYARPKAQVEAEIFKRMATPQSPTGIPKPANPYAPYPPTVAGSRPATGKSSFLDDWLRKRQVQPGQGSIGAPINPYANNMANDTYAQPNAAQAAPMPARQPINTAKSAQQVDLSKNTQVDYVRSDSKPSVAKPSTVDQKALDEKLQDLKKSNQGEISLRDEVATEDTISIDQEGNIHNQSETNPKP